MAYSTCPKCDNTYFEVTNNSPSKSNYKLLFVQCSKCGCVVGTMDYYNIGAKLEELEKKVERISSSSSGMSSVNNNLAVINQNIGNLYNLIRTLEQKIDGKRDKNQRSIDTE